MITNRMLVGTWTATAVIAAILVAGSWSTRAELPMSPRLIPTFRLEGFAPGVVVAQTVTAARDGLSRIDIGIAPSSRRASIDFMVRTAEGAVVAEERLTLNPSPTRREARLSFAPLQRSAGQTFVIEARGTDEGAPIALEGVSPDGLRDGQLIDPHRSLAETRDLDMNVRLYQSRTFGEALGDFARTERPAAIAAGGLSVGLLLVLTAVVSKATRTRPSVALGPAVSVYAALVFGVVRFVIGFG